MVSAEKQPSVDGFPLHDEGREISVDGLSAILRMHERGMSGEAPKREQIIDMRTMVLYLDTTVAQWEPITRLLEEVETTYRKLLGRHPTIKIDSAKLHEELSRKINNLVNLAEFPKTETGYNAVKRLVESVGRKDAEYYLSDDFIWDLQDYADDEAMQQAMGSFFSVAEMLRRATVTRDVVEGTRQSVIKAVEINNDKEGYLARATGGKANDLFVGQLTPSALLYFTTHNLNSIDETLAEKAMLFEELVRTYPTIASVAPDRLFGLVRTGGKGEKSTLRIHEWCEDMERQLVDGSSVGMSKEELRYMVNGATRREAKLKKTRYGFFRLGRDVRHRLTPGTAGAIAAELSRSEFVPLSAYGTFEEGSEYRNVILAVNHSCRPETREDVVNAFDTIDSIKQLVESWVELLPQNEVGQRYAASLQRAYEKRITEIASLIPGLLKGEQQTGIQINGGSSIAVAVDSLIDVVDALKALEFHAKNLLVAYQNGFSESSVPVGQAIGRFESLVVPMAVSLRPEETQYGEARQAWRSVMSLEEQLAVFGKVVCEKATAVTVRLDFEDSTHRLSLDFGGNLDGPLNELLARVTTVGAQTIGNYRSGNDDKHADYHVREVFDEDLADPEVFRRYLVGAMYSLEIHLPSIDDQDSKLKLAA